MAGNNTNATQVRTTAEVLINNPYPLYARLYARQMQATRSRNSRINWGKKI